jgi:ribosomal protein L33, bacterial type
MAKKGHRQQIIIRHKETGHSYHTTKNKQNTSEKITIKKYNPMLRQHVDYVEVKS